MAKTIRSLISRRFPRLGVRSKFIGALALTGFVGSLALAAVCHELARRALRENVCARLDSVAESRVARLRELDATVCGNAQVLGHGLTAAQALTAFGAACSGMRGLGPDAATQRRLEAFYADYAKNLNDTFGGKLAVAMPEDPVARLLQAGYCIDANAESRLDRADSGTGTAYDAVHAKYHPVLREILRGYPDFVDMHLVDENARVVYTALKEPDFAVSLRSPAYRDTGLAVAYRAIASAKRPVALVDFEPYGASHGESAAFVAAPVFVAGERRGVVVFQLRQEAVARVMDGISHTGYAGLGETGEVVCMAASDGRLRATPRAYLAAPAAFLRTLDALGASAQQLEQTVRAGTPVAHLSVDRDPEATARAMPGPFAEMPDYRGVPSLITVRPVAFGDARWFIQVKMDAREAFDDVAAFDRALLLGVVLTMSGILGVAWWLSRRLVSPVLRLSEAARTIGKGGVAVVPQLGTGDEFEGLADDFNRMVLSLREKTRQVEEKDRVKTRFLAQMSHELRTPMNAVLGYAQILERDTALTSHQRAEVSGILRAGGHLMATLDDILEITKMESDQVRLVATPLDLGRLIDSVVSPWRSSAKEKGLSLRVACAHDLPRCVVADGEKLTRILANVLGNAVKFTARGGVVFSARLAHCEDRYAHLEFTIDDTGPGVRSNEAASIFDPFVQGAAGESRGGAGLGLSISRRYARLMGGDIVQSTPASGGARFVVTLRLQTGALSLLDAPVERRVPLRLAREQGEVRVLVVDDDPTIRALFSDFLVPVGFTIRVAQDGVEACEAAADWSPHAILMDLRMPRMDGYAASRHIRAASPDSNVVILAVSASIAEADEVLAAGMDDLIGKPFRRDEVLDRLGARLGLDYEYDGSPTVVAPAPVSRPAAPSGPPDALHAEVLRAAREADYEALLNCVDRFPERERALAERVRSCVLKFDYEGVARLVEAASGGPAA